MRDAVTFGAYQVRAATSNYALEIAPVWRRKFPQYFLQPPGMVVGGEYDRSEHQQSLA
jgi:hypothetical protein